MKIPLAVLLALIAVAACAKTRICPKKNLFPLYVPHKASRSQFYRCLGGKELLLHCRRGQVFDELTGECITEIHSKSRRVIVDDVTRVMCGEGIQYLPDPYDCTKFYQCSNGRPILMECPEGTEWDAQLNVCNWPEAANCVEITRPTDEPEVSTQDGGDSSEEGDSSSSEEDGSSSSEEDDSSSEEDDDSAAEDDGSDDDDDGEEEDQEEDGIVCHTEGENAEYLPDPYDCTKFYECANGIPVHMDCAPGTEFDVSINVCNWPDAANCTEIPRPTEGPEVSTEDGDNAGKQEIDAEEEEEDVDEIICDIESEDAEYFPDPYDCTKFYECANGFPVHMDCAPGTEFDATINVCNWPDAANCVATPRPTDGPEVSTEDGYETDKQKRDTDEELEDEDEEQTNDIICHTEGENAEYLPDPYDCTKFYECANGIPVHMDCAPGTEFDATINVCNWPDAANCTAIPRPTDGPEVSTQDGDDADKEEVDEEEEEEDEMICDIDSEDAQYFPDPYDCTKFYECADGTPVHMDCAPGTEFDATINVCNWPDAANCVAIPRPTDGPEVSTEDGDMVNSL